MKKIDVDREISEAPLTRADFLRSYNHNIPQQFPRASTALLNEFRTSHSELFKRGDNWSLDQHRKKVMDWLSLNAIVRSKA